MDISLSDNMKMGMIGKIQNLKKNLFFVPNGNNSVLAWKYI